MPAGSADHLLDLLQDRHRFGVAGFKRSTLLRAVDHRMRTAGVDGYALYAGLLASDPAEYGALVDTVLINVTSFFRDRTAWRRIRDSVIPALLDRSGPGRGIRVWCAGCSTGEEVYSLASLFAEALGEEDFRRRVTIFGTDLDPVAIATARLGRYSEAAMRPVPEHLRTSFFEDQDGDWVFRPDLRGRIVFGRNNLDADPPIGRIDLLACRNTLIYFTGETQEQVLRGFRRSLNPGGVLFLGTAELLLRHADLFTPIDADCRLFIRSDQPNAGAFSPVRAWVEEQAGQGDPRPPASTDELVLMTEELRCTREDLSATRAELRSTNEELRMINRELAAIHRTLTPGDGDGAGVAPGP